MGIIIVDRKTPFSFPEEIVADYGIFEIRQQNEIAAKVLEFTLGDVMFFNPRTCDMQRASTFQEKVIKEGFIPLDSYCARAIYQNEEALSELGFSWFGFKERTRKSSLRKIMFLGDTVFRENHGIKHFSFFKFHFMSDRVDFLPCEDDIAFIKNEDFILVFKKSFIKKLLGV